MQESGFSVTVFSCIRTVDSVLIPENTGQWKPVFSHILYSVKYENYSCRSSRSTSKLLTKPGFPYITDVDDETVWKKRTASYWRLDFPWSDGKQNFQTKVY